MYVHVHAMSKLYFVDQKPCFLLQHKSISSNLLLLWNQTWESRVFICHQINLLWREFYHLLRQLQLQVRDYSFGCFASSLFDSSYSIMYTANAFIILLLIFAPNLLTYYYSSLIYHIGCLDWYCNCFICTAFNCSIMYIMTNSFRHFFSYLHY